MYNAFWTSSVIYQRYLRDIFPHIKLFKQLLCIWTTAMPLFIIFRLNTFSSFIFGILLAYHVMDKRLTSDQKKESAGSSPTGVDYYLLLLNTTLLYWSDKSKRCLKFAETTTGTCTCLNTLICDCICIWWMCVSNSIGRERDLISLIWVERTLQWNLKGIKLYW